MDAVCGSDLQCPVRGHRRRQESARTRRGGDRGLATTGCDRRVRRGVLPPRACGAAAHLIGVRSATVSGPSPLPPRASPLAKEAGLLSRICAAVQISALGQKQTCAAHKLMSALPPKATAKADIRKRSCLLYTRKRTCAVQSEMSALGQKQTC